MTWCDKLASVPTVGFALTPDYRSGDQIIDLIRPILNRNASMHRPDFSVGQHQSFMISINMNNGKNFDIEPVRISVRFEHKIKIRDVSGALPVMEILSEPRPYTELLKDVSVDLLELAALLRISKERQILRVGIVSITKVSEEDLPPGIEKMLEYMARPWKKKFEHFNIQIAGEIQNSADKVDRCIHTIQKSEESGSLITVTLDWQRLFAKGLASSEANFRDALRDAQRDSLRYFEELAEGARFDESLIGTTA